MLNIPRVPGCRRLKQETFDLFMGDRSVFGPVGHNQEFAGTKLHCPIPELDLHVSADGQKELILRIVVMPDELSLELYQLHFLPVQLAYNFRAPVLRDCAKLFFNVDFFHTAKVAKR